MDVVKRPANAILVKKAIVCLLLFSCYNFLFSFSAVQVISKGEIVDCAYRNPYVDAEVIEAECELLSAVVGALNGHPGVAMWNLGNEPDLVAIPTRDQALAWIRVILSQLLLLFFFFFFFIIPLAFSLLPAYGVDYSRH